MAKPIFKVVDNGYDVVAGEAELSRDLLGIVDADVFHLDLSLGAVSIENLFPVQLTNMKISSKASQGLLRLLPRLRKVAGEIRRVYGLDMLAIGKDSLPVRVAELTAAESVLFACRQALEKKEEILLGLPSRCQPRIVGGRLYLHSLIASEHDVRGYAEDAADVLSKVNIAETLNPCARGFRALRAKPAS